MTYITTAATNAIGTCYGIRIEINKTLTGTLTIADSRGTQGIIAIAGTGNKVYYGFQGAVTVTNSATEDVTVSALSRQGT